MNLLDRRSVRTGIKSGFGYGDFLEKYGLEKEALESSIKGMYKNNPNDAEEIIKEIAKNEKKRLRKTEKVEITEYKGVPVEEIKKMTMEEFLRLDGKEEEIKVPSKLDLERTELEKTIKSLSDKLIVAETEHKRWHIRHKDHLNQILGLDKKLAKLEEDLKQVKAKYDEIVNLDDEVIEKANKALEEKQRLERALAENRETLRKLKMVMICAYEDGTIALFDEAAEISLDETGNEDIFMSLIEDSRCEELKAKEIKVLARLLAIIKNTSYDIEVVCDNNELERVLKEIR